MRAGFNPVFLEASNLDISELDFDFAIEADGTTNLSKVVGKPATPEEEEGESEPASAGGSTPAAPPVPPPAATASPASPATAEVTPIRIDTLTLQGGRIGLADHFIQPNYAATLTELTGRMTGLSSKAGTVAQLDLEGRLANHSPLKVTGSVNPLAATAFADVKASFRDIDLPPFTPYSGKYAGYAIARGAITMEVSYKLQNRKLSAQNRFLVNQFEFGDKIESPTATKLPVKLAISLLKDRNGVIDIDLPIEGSLDDPKFRIGKIIWKLVGNLITKAVTAPFALIGQLFGGGSSGELSSVDFADGSAALDDAAKKKLDALAKALDNRPALTLEATGRFSGDVDSEGLKRLRFERKVKAQKLADLAKKGVAPASVDDVVVDEKEHAVYLAKAYKAEKFDKPRNVLGIAKGLPPEEMESLMLANVAVTNDDLRQLAFARANVVKDYLTGAGKVEAARVFVLEPGRTPSERKEGARGSRVDFSLR
jgi:outer membrane protein OmpA-like peptidoglycan-associated protein